MAESRAFRNQNADGDKNGRYSDSFVVRALHQARRVDPQPIHTGPNLGPILGQKGVEDPVRNLVRKFVRMSHADRFTREEILAASHFGCLLQLKEGRNGFAESHNQ